MTIAITFEKGMWLVGETSAFHCDEVHGDYYCLEHYEICGAKVTKLPSSCWVAGFGIRKLMDKGFALQLLDIRLGL